MEAVDASLGHYRINGRVAPSDYGFNKIKLVAAAGGGHAETGAAGWTFGLAAVGAGRAAPPGSVRRASRRQGVRPGSRWGS